VPKPTNWDRYFAGQMADRDMRKMVAEELEALRVGAELARLRRKAGLTQEQLAARCGMKAPNLSRIENAPSPNLTLSTICKVAGALGRETLVFSKKKRATMVPAPRVSRQAPTRRAAKRTKKTP
jgi:transcriptional regulator with XRE-family HTH domain